MNHIKHFYALLVLSISVMSVAVAQQSGVKGLVLDLESMQPIAGTSLTVVNTGQQATTDENGEFFIALSKDGAVEYTITASMLGYAQDSSTFKVDSDEAAFVSLLLLGENSVLDAVVVTRRRERASEIALLDMRRRSNLMLELIGSQELSRKGISDAGTAVSRMTGVSRQEGSNEVFVRGLGDRYNNTTLNGLPIPSNDPELKNIELGLFSSDIIEYLTIDKVYSSYLTGDFAGGNVDIASKNYDGRGFFEVGIGSNVNTNVINNWDNFMLQDGPSPLGYANYGVPNDPLGGFNFQNSMNPVKKTPFAGNVSLLGGKSFSFNNGHRLNLFGTANFNSDTYQREGINRRLSAGGEVQSDLYQNTFGYRTNSTGMINAKNIMNPEHRISYNVLFVKTSDQFRDDYWGEIRDMAEDGTAWVKRATFIQNKMFVNQLLGKHQLDERLGLDWGLSYNNVVVAIPDRLQNYMQYSNEYGYDVFIRNNVPDNHRYFQDLTEQEVAANVAANYRLADDKGLLSVGYNGKIKRRAFEDFQVNFWVPRNHQIYPNDLDEFFNQENVDAGLIDLRGFNADLPQSYDGEQDIHAPYATLEYQLTEKLSGTLGVRYENIRQSVSFLTQLDRSGQSNVLQRNEFLPSLLLKYTLDEQQNLRMGLSKTYTLPQFKERAFFMYENVNESKQGNPNLYPSQDYNLDLRWEYFPSQSELISVTAFGKYIQDPINEVLLASSSNLISYVNIGDYGTVYGVEVEFKKDLVSTEGFGKLSVGANAAYIKTDQVIDSEKVSRETVFPSGGNYNINLTSERSSFTGASDFLANADLSYFKAWGNGSDITATVVYNYFSDRLYALGSEGRGNQIDQGVGTMDFILKYKFNRNWGLDVNARNVFDPTYNRIQESANGPLDIFSYKRGTRFSLGVKYSF